jgi:ABC-type antimicrobial peptide transport system permease subunit
MLEPPCRDRNPDPRDSDPLVLLTTATILAIATEVAAWVPAQRAARMDPMSALSSE